MLDQIEDLGFAFILCALQGLIWMSEDPAYRVSRAPVPFANDPSSPPTHFELLAESNSATIEMKHYPWVFAILGWLLTAILPAIGVYLLPMLHQRWLIQENLLNDNEIKALKTGGQSGRVHKEIEMLTETNGNLVKKVAEATEAANAWGDKLLDAMNELILARETHFSAEQEAEQWKTRAEETEESLASTRRKLQATEEANISYQRTLNDSARRIREQDQKIAQDAEKIKKMEKSSTEARSAQAESEATQRKLHDEIAALQVTIANERAHSRQQVEEAEAFKKTTADEMTKLENTNSAQLLTIDTLEKAIVEARNVHAQSDSELKELREVVEEMQAVTADVKAHPVASSIIVEDEEESGGQHTDDSLSQSGSVKQNTEEPPADDSASKSESVEQNTDKPTTDNSVSQPDSVN